MKKIRMGMVGGGEGAFIELAVAASASDVKWHSFPPHEESQH